MRHETAIAVIEALGDTLLAKDSFIDYLKGHAEHLSEDNARLRHDIGELIGRDDEKIKAECEEIENGACCDCNPESEGVCEDECENTLAQPSYFYGDYMVLTEAGLTAEILSNFLNSAGVLIGELDADMKIKDICVCVTKETIAWKIEVEEEISQFMSKEPEREAEA